MFWFQATVIFQPGFSLLGKMLSALLWFTKSSAPTVVWMATRDQPVNGNGSKLSLNEDGNLVLLDADRVPLWSTETKYNHTVELKLDNTGSRS